jgi:hypothetical protein
LNPLSNINLIHLVVMTEGLDLILLVYTPVLAIVFDK